MRKKIKKEEVSIFDEIIGERVSILIDHPKPHSKLKESYVGNCIGRKGGFLAITFDCFPDSKLKFIYVREDQIISIWVYNDNKGNSYL